MIITELQNHYGKCGVIVIRTVALNVQILTNLK